MKGASKTVALVLAFLLVLGGWGLLIAFAVTAPSGEEWDALDKGEQDTLSFVGVGLLIAVGWGTFWLGTLIHHTVTREDQ